ncbi:hypothetical protein AB0B79_26405 [Streptomyces sp. NPDC039022]|uniref:hypothetical protein n=1 Tax=Streptomyces sp. NPDC039022 TaxID=3157091 RepID=UPI00340CF5CB
MMHSTAADEALAGFFLRTVGHLAETKAREFYERGRRLPAHPWGTVKSPAHPYHCVTATCVTAQDKPPGNFLPGGLAKLLTGTDEQFTSSVAATLGDAFEHCLAYSSPGSREERANCITVTGEELVRVDGTFWIYRFPSNGITREQTAVSCCLMLSHMLPEETPLAVLRLTAQRMVSKLKGLTDTERDRKRQELQKRMEDRHSKGAAGRKPIALDKVNKQAKKPQRVALDAQGNLYVSDYRTASIWRAGPDGKCAVVAGGGTSAKDGIKATEALLVSPMGLAVDGAGVLHIAEQERVRRVSPGPDGKISTVARCEADSPFRPVIVKADLCGNVYVLCIVHFSKKGIGQLWHLRPDGDTVRTPLAEVSYDAGQGLLADLSFRVLLTYRRGIRAFVKSMTPQGKQGHVIAGGGRDAGIDGVPALEADLPHAGAMDTDRAGNLYLIVGSSVRKITPGGMIYTAVRAAAQDQFISLAVNPDGTYLYTVNLTYDRVERYRIS